MAPIRTTKLIIPISLAAALLLMVVMVATAQMPSLSQDITACWDLEEGSGTRYDALGRFDLTDNNTVNGLDGLVDYGAYFQSANSEYLSYANHPAFVGDGKTYMAWIKLDVDDLNRLYARYGWGSNEFLLYTNNGWLVYDVYYTGGVTHVAVQHNYGGFTLDQWYLVMAWHDKAAGTINIQVDDGIVYSNSFTGTVHSSTTGLMSIGAQWYFDGMMDTLAMWDRTLTAEERTWLYNGGSGRSCGKFLGTGAGDTYDIPLPSGATGTVDMTITAGNAGVIVVLSFITVLMVYYLFSLKVKEGRATAK